MRNPFTITLAEVNRKPRKWHDFVRRYWSPSARYDGRTLHPIQREFERTFGCFVALVNYGVEDEHVGVAVVTRLPFIHVLGSWSSVGGSGSASVRPKEAAYWRLHLRRNHAACRKCAGWCYSRSHGRWGAPCTRCGGIGIDPTAYRRNYTVGKSDSPEYWKCHR